MVLKRCTAGASHVDGDRDPGQKKPFAAHYDHMLVGAKKVKRDHRCILRRLRLFGKPREPRIASAAEVDH
ncbi:hypothetical protein AND_003994 [Anopheles darlingi]|uniref:Uncharacterized protein n=1 Tax=Anopheles darlingi TaxID=43151 RepID=W5JLV9_ANODA|nr:hypothetical protein AND_003994 [Anopheles darlingi]